ncbi:hypothetical protein [Ectothiorhodospira lacustris]|uniref:hypothetical protein n=1 Tax=Ectothiorhodospira lacustris TaxID=2899127 RepID=UPI001EE8F8C1|nr:hypothetical protein [Ectothiorhodospira lacustris]MCG5501812.1 hypothetical protein [Ectothiorhodospira lacustris]MCG5511481.1 hypothetical protein [Ectothiorhodospira lacustris]MCG5523269.1 hypothetical protein [Ectothiorhodospira lacustris]
MKYRLPVGYRPAPLARTPRRPLDCYEGCFTRGFVTAACISAFQDVEPPLSRPALRRVMRHGLQGGTALVAGTRAANAVRRGDYLSAVTAATAGAAGVMIIERLLRPSPAREDKEQKKDG